MDTINSSIKKYPFTSYQRDIYVEQLLHENSGLYTIGAITTIHGTINHHLFQDAVNLVIKKHDALRIRIGEKDGEAYQYFTEPFNYPLPFYDFSGVEDPSRHFRLWVKTRVSENFVLYNNNLFEFALLKYYNEKTYLFQKYHHIIIDGWGFSLIFIDMEKIYNAISKKEPVHMEPAYSYRDFIEENGLYIKSQKYLRDKEYWSRKFQTLPPGIPINAKHILTKEYTKSRRTTLIIKRIQYNCWISFSEKHKIPVFTYILGSLFVYFSKIFAVFDMVIGVAFLNRRKPAFKKTAGSFVTIAPVRVTIKDQQSFSDFLIDVRNVLGEAYRYSQLSSAEINNLVIHSHTTSRKLFDICFSYEIQRDNHHFDGNKINIKPFAGTHEPNLLTIHVREYQTEENILIDFDYQERLFDAAFTARGMLSQVKNIFEKLMDTPDISIGDIEIPTAWEKKRIITVFNATKKEYPCDKTIVQVFEETARKYPGKTALVCGNTSLTYEKLDDNANRVGKLLREEGVGRDMPVGILMERSCELITGILGILKAGGAYLPLAGDYPWERIRSMLHECGASILLTHTPFIGRVKSPGKIINMDDLVCNTKDTGNLEAINKPDDLANIIFTSGTSGKPKGSMILHKGVIRLVKNPGYMHFDENTKILQIASIVFDAATFEIWGALLNGGTLVITDKDVILDAQRLQQELLYHEINTLLLISSLFNQLMDQGSCGIFSSLRYLLVGGEVLSAKHINLVREALPELQVINAYGPTENTVISTCYEIKKSFTDAIPIGKPIGNSTCYIMDSHSHLMPIGVPGELCVGGDGVSRGYVKRPDLTREKFIADPFEQGGKLYKTGDLARWLPDGTIEYLGRMDNQVKIRGNRIEPGEIEKVMAQYSGIKETAVIVRTGKNTDKYLCAYFTADYDIDTGQLKNFMKSSLPDYMIPSFYVQLPRFPLTPNGKLDRNALPEPETSEKNETTEYSAPENKIEEQVLSIWEDVLEIKKIGTRDNFFELGGHSLKAIQIILRINKVFGTNLKFKDIFDAPSIKEIALKTVKSPGSLYKEIEVAPEREYYQPSPGQKRIWILNRMENNTAVYNIPFCFLLKGKLDTHALQKAYSSLIQRHESLRTVFFYKDGKPYQKIIANPGYSLAIVDMHAVSIDDKQVRLLAENECKKGFNLEKGPLARMTILQCKKENHLIVINMHHSISDGRSFEVFISELSAAYNAFVVNKTPQFTPLPIQYRDYTAWFNSLLSTDAIKRQQEYWIKTLSPDLIPVALPADFPRLVFKTFNGMLRHYELDDEFYRMLKKMVIKHQTTLYSILAALVMIILYRYTGKTDITIGLPVSGRNHILLEEQIGFFINTIVLRREIRGETGFCETMESVKAALADAFSNQDYPFDLLVDDLNIPRDTSRSPLFAVMVVLHTSRMNHLDLNGCESKNMMFDINTITTSKFDITFHFYEADGKFSLAAEYNTDLFLVSRIDRLIGHIKQLAKSIYVNPAQPIDTLEFIPRKERKRIIAFSENYDAMYPEHETLVSLFEKQVQKTPYKTALLFNDRALTYQELNKKANSLAHLLRSSGIKRESIVALVLERSPDMVIALLGIIKAGGAYLPIAPDFPIERINYMLKDSDAGCLLLGREYNKELQFKMKCIRLDESPYEDYPQTNPEPVNLPNDCAYIIYTSGTTGIPKGVMIEHRNVVRLLFNSKFPYDFNQDDVWSLFHSYCFDFSVWEMYGALLYGGKLVIVPREMTLDPGEYVQFLLRHNVTVLNQTPSVFYRIQEHALALNNAGFRLKYIIFGGEKLDPYKLAEWHGKYPQTKLINMYGITEVTVHATIKEIGSDEIEKNTSTIGRAIPTSSTYILDKNLHLLPFGITGEICVGGKGVARGYLHLEKLTKERFIPNPFKKGDTLYRSGDYAKFLANGDIEYETRKDQQIQIRGFRVELGDIETHLRKIDGIKDAVVLNNTDNKGEIYLCAYLVSNKQYTVNELKHLISESVPYYMVPDKYVMVNKIPLTQNGKIDKKALLSKTDYVLPGTEYEEARNEIEKRLHSIWKAVLQREDFGVHDSFFELGGNSLLLIHMHTEIEKLYPSSIRIVDIFSFPTIREIAIVIERKIKPSPERIPSQRIKVRKKTFYPDIAVIGIGLRIGDCTTKEEFWDSLCKNRDFIRDIPEERKKDAGLFGKIICMEFQGNAKFKKLNYLERIDAFDYSFFQLSPREASLMDPNQRIFLETAWNTLEDAGYGGDTLKGSSTGVFIGYNSGKVTYDRLFPGNDSDIANLALSGNTPSIIAGRISYLLNLKGPALCVDTACSSSLAAIHLACKSIQRGECEMAMAGGIKIYLCPLDTGIRYEIESPDNKVRPFDDDANGTQGGEGAVAFLLKPLIQAENDNDTVYAVIKGSMMNQDGRSAGMTAPSAEAQAMVIVKAWEDARIDPISLSFIEAHGTGTRLGDPIEVEGITEAFRKYTGKKQFCALSSVKANIGHLDTTAGAAGLLKSIFVLRHHLLPPLLHYKKSNRQIDFASSPLYINREPLNLMNNSRPLLCGISSFGLSGTNCHLVVEEYKNHRKPHDRPDRPFPHIFTLSGKTFEVLLQQVNNYHSFLKNNQHLLLSDICYTTNCGRGHHNYRLAIIRSDREGLLADLQTVSEYTENTIVSRDNIFYDYFKVIPENKNQKGIHELTEREVEEKTGQAALKITLFTSSGDQEIVKDIARLYVNGATVCWEELYRENTCNRIPLPVYPFLKTRSWFVPEISINRLQGGESSYAKELKEEVLIHRCMARSLEEDIYSTLFNPDSFWLLKDHTIDNVPVLPGVAFLEICCKIAVRYYPDEQYTIENLSLLKPLAIVSGFEKEVQIVVLKKSGYLLIKIISEKSSALAGEEQWTIHARGEIRPVPGTKKDAVSIQGIKNRLHHLDNLDIYNRPGKNRYIVQAGKQWKTITEIYRDGDSALVFLNLDPQYLPDLADFILYPPLIDSAVSALLAFEEDNYLPFFYKKAFVYEKTPASFYSYIKKEKSGKNFICSVTLIKTTGQVFAEFDDVTFKKIGQVPVFLSGEDMYYHITWKQRSPLQTPVPFMNRTVLVIHNHERNVSSFITWLEKKNNRCIQATPGDGYAKRNENDYTIGTEESDYQELFRALKNETISVIIHLHSLKNEDPGVNMALMEKRKQDGLISAFFMVKGLLTHHYKQCSIIFICRNVYKVTGKETTYNPESAALFGFAKVIHSEYPNLDCICLDVDEKTDIAAAFECIREDEFSPIAVREKKKYIQEISGFEHGAVRERNISILAGNTYLITGGLGGIGLEIAAWIAKKANTLLILVSRSLFPGRDQWENILCENKDKETIEKINAIKKIEQSGSQVLLYAVDITDYGELKKVIDHIHMHLGRISGIFHCAGIPGKGFIVNKDIKQLKAVIGPKMEGTRNIDVLTEQDDPDFFIMSSAMSVNFGTAGQGDYNAANSFLDVYASYRNLNHTNTFSINWAAWKETGMALKHHAPFDTVFYGLSSGEALKAMDYIMEKGPENTIVGRLNMDFILSLGKSLPVKFSAAIKGMLQKKEKESVKTPEKSPKPVTLKGRTDDHYTETEKRIAAIWAESLGFASIDIFKDFYELGGDSINASVIINAINKEFALHENIITIFDYPTIHQYAEYIGNAPAVVHHIDKRDGDTEEKAGAFPLSAAQRRLYILHQLNKTAINYNLPVFYIIEGQVDPQKLEASINRVMERHWSFRTSFHVIDGRLVQKINNQGKFLLPVFRVSENELKIRINEFIKPFDLAKPPLLRVELCLLSENKALLLIDMHHIISDALSIKLFVDEVFTIYCSREPFPLEAQYTDFTLWQNSLLQSEAITSQKHYWMNLFADSIPVLELPLDFPRPDIMSVEGDVVVSFADSELTKELREFAREHRVTPYILVLSAFFLLLHKYSHQEDIVIGSMTLTRPKSEFEKIIGLFINILPIRTRPERGKKVIDYIHEVNMNGMQGFKNQDYQFDELVEQLEIPRNLQRNPLTDVYFSYMNFYKKKGNMDLSYDTLRLKPYTGERKFASKADITLFCTETESLTFAFEYCPGLFTKRRMERFSRHFTGILKSMIENPENTIAGIDYMSREEKNRILIDFNNTKREYPPDESVIGLFKCAVRKSPEGKALMCNDKSINYRELDQWSDYLACLLLEKGVNKESKVGILIHRSMEMIAAIIAVIKTGACYVPIDTLHPKDRIAYMLDHCGAEILMTDSTMTSRLIFRGRIITCDNTLGEKCREAPLYACNNPGDLLYIIYTSGSTGEPKGIGVEHHNFMNYLHYMKEIVQFPEGCRILCASSISFDIFSFETILPLTAGMCVVILDDDEQKDPGKIGGRIIKNSIDVIQFTPSRLKLLLQVDNTLECLKNVRTLLLAGEKISPALFHTVKQHYKNRFFNGYGPTEATVYTTMKDLTQEEKVTIGTPVANSKIYILDENEQLVPVGVPGELCISGLCVSRGYIHNETLHKKHFKQDPFDLSQRFYKSGDIAQWCENGDIEIFGRMDRQVKIRGYRIELSGIEVLVKQYQGIIDCVVIDGKGATGEDYLSAYIVSLPGVDTEGLKEYLKIKLPDYMLPSYFIRIGSIPLNANGKIDRARFPLPDRSYTGGMGKFIAPSLPLELLIADVWKEVLQVDQVSIDDNYFDHGGSSYNIIKLQAGLNNLFGRDIDLITLFKYPTIRLFSHYIQDDREITGNDRESDRIKKLSDGKEKLRQRRARRRERYE